MPFDVKPSSTHYNYFTKEKRKKKKAFVLGGVAWLPRSNGIKVGFVCEGFVFMPEFLGGQKKRVVVAD